MNTKPTSDMVARMLGADRAVEVPSLPDQPQHEDDKGVMRFVKNRIVDELVEHGRRTGFGLNEIAARVGEDFSPEEYSQLAQLVGYSVYGWGTLSFVSDELWERATQTVDPAPQLNRDQSVAVSPTYTYNEDMTQAPRSVKLILLGQGGVAHISEYNGESFWIGWAALPRRAGGV